jgi:HEAT repeat protein
VVCQDDDRLAQHLLECIALGSWAGKPFVVPPPFRSSYARMRISTLFLPPSGLEPARAERVLLQAARSTQPAVRETALTILGVMRTQHALPCMMDALQDPIEAVRLQAIKGLGQLGSPEAIPALVRALSTASEPATAQIFVALAHIGKEAVPALLDLSASRSAWIRWNCLRALRKTYDRRAIPALARALRDVDHGVAWMGAKGLAEFGTPGIEPVLRSLATDELTSWQVETSIYVFSHQHDQKVRPYLKPLLADLHSLSYTQSSIPYLAYQVLNHLLADGVLNRASEQL